MAWMSFAPPAFSQDDAVSEYPEIERFAAAIEDKIWELQGTRSLKRLRYDGEHVCSLNSRDEPGSPYDSAFVDVGVIRLNLRGPNTGWYFFANDLKWVTPVTASGEIVFALAAGTTAKPVQKFPQDIDGVVWEMEADERGLPPMKLRWNGRELEIGINQDGEWAMEKLPAAVADRRVLEVELPDGSAVWYAFSADGEEAWFLQVVDIYGGRVREASVPAREESVAVPEGMSKQNGDLYRHALRLKAAGEAGRVATLKRYLLRRYDDDAEVTAAVESALP